MTFANLTDAEMIAGILQCDIDVAKRVCQEAGYDLRTLKTFYDSSLKEYGLKPAQIKRLRLVTDLTTRFRTWNQKNISISTSRDAYNYVNHLSDLSHEEFYIIIVNRKNKVMELKHISTGGVNGAVIDPRLVFRRPIEMLASGIVLVHNHPSGGTTPSDSDIELTTKLKNAGKILDIQVLDHIIVGGDEYYSFADEGAL